jgi:hypothetical protein
MSNSEDTDVLLVQSSRRVPAEQIPDEWKEPYFDITMSATPSSYATRWGQAELELERLKDREMRQYLLRREVDAYITDKQYRRKQEEHKLLNHLLILEDTPHGV